MKHIGSFFKFYSVGIIITLVFFIVGLATLSHYGNNIDESIHFERGNAYLDFFLTGRKKYTSQDFKSPRNSEWKYKGYDTAYFLKNDAGHPPLNDILAAATNRIFHEKLGIMGDLESYHLFEIFVSSLVVFLVFAMIRKRYGVFAGIIASLSMALYPLFYGESHYNIKDPIETSFFAFTLYFFYLGIEKVKGRYFFISSLFCALAFGTKFNIIFFPVILLPYLLIKFSSSFIFQRGKLEKIKRIPKSVLISLLFYPFIVLGIHFATRPFLWQDPFNRFIQVLQYYKDIGTGTNYQSRFLKHGFNTYPTIFAGISTPLVILVYFLIGILVALSRIKKGKDKFSIMLLSWFGITILRVSLPGTSIYGGVRQIMEYIPAMAAISGLGALYIRATISKFMNIKFASILVLVTFIPLVATLIKMHPNENIFMNSLVGGLKGATEKKIPGVGETMGNAYLQGILWLNDHAEKNARFGFPEGLGSNFPPQFVRKDIKFGGHFSGMKRDGEYMMEMFSVEYPFSKYHIDYLQNFLNPVHVISIDEVPILKIWKNDKEHTRSGFLEEVEQKNLNIIGSSEKGFIEVDLEKSSRLVRIIINHSDKDCLNEDSGVVSYSVDGKKEFRTPDDLFRSQGRYADSLQTRTEFTYFFTGQSAKTIKITPDDNNLCLLKFKNIRVFALKTPK